MKELTLSLLKAMYSAAYIKKLTKLLRPKYVYVVMENYSTLREGPGSLVETDSLVSGVYVFNKSALKREAKLIREAKLLNYYTYDVDITKVKLLGNEKVNLK